MEGINMLQLMGQLLPNAVGVTVSTVPLIVLLVFMFTKNGKQSAVTFTLGWMIGIFLTVGVVQLFGIKPQAKGQPSAFTGWFDLVMGALFIYLAIQQWRGRPRKGEPQPEPKWVSKLNNVKPIMALPVGIFFIVVNAKNLPLMIKAGISIAESSIGDASKLIVILAYTIVAAIIPIIITVAFMIFGDKISKQLHEIRDWLGRNSNYIMTVIFGIMGVEAVSNSLQILG